MTSTVTPIHALPRRVPTPQTEPPYDDEVRTAIAPTEEAAVQGTLALSYALPTGAPTTPAPRLRLVPAPPERTHGGRPDPAAWTTRLAQAVTEVLSGDRPATQLLRWTTEQIYTELARRAAATARELTVVRTGRTRPMVRRVVLCEPRDGVVEASAVVRQGARTRAMALRLHGTGDHWVCTALEMH